MEVVKRLRDKEIRYNEYEVYFSCYVSYFFLYELICCKGTFELLFEKVIEYKLVEINGYVFFSLKYCI